MSVSILRPVGEGFLHAAIAAMLGFAAPASSAQVVEENVTLAEVAQTTLAELGPKSPLSNGVGALGFSPDGATLAVGMRDPNTILLLDSTTLAVRSRLTGHRGLVSKLAFLPDGKTLVSTGHDGTIRLWDVATAKERLLIDPLQSNLRDLAVSPDGSRIYTCESSRGFKGVAQAWSTRDGKLLASLDTGNHGVESLAITRDGRMLATASRDKTIRLWDLKTYDPINVFEAEGSFPNSLAFAPDGRSLFAVFHKDASIRMFDVPTLNQKYRTKTDARTFLYLDVSPAGSILATADFHRLQLWNASNAAALASIPETGVRIAVICFSPDGRSIVVGGESGRIKVFRIDRVADGKIKSSCRAAIPDPTRAS